MIGPALALLHKELPLNIRLMGVRMSNLEKIGGTKPPPDQQTVRKFFTVTNTPKQIEQGDAEEKCTDHCPEDVGSPVDKLRGSASKRVVHDDVEGRYADQYDAVGTETFQEDCHIDAGTSLDGSHFRDNFVVPDSLDSSPVKDQQSHPVAHPEDAYHSKPQHSIDTHSALSNKPWHSHIAAVQHSDTHAQRSDQSHDKYTPNKPTHAKIGGVQHSDTHAHSSDTYSPKKRMHPDNGCADIQHEECDAQDSGSPTKRAHIHTSMIDTSEHHTADLGHTKSNSPFKSEQARAMDTNHKHSIDVGHVNNHSFSKPAQTGMRDTPEGHGTGLGYSNSNSPFKLAQTGMRDTPPDHGTGLGYSNSNSPFKLAQTGLRDTPADHGVGLDEGGKGRVGAYIPDIQILFAKQEQVFCVCVCVCATCVRERER